MSAAAIALLCSECGARVDPGRRGGTCSPECSASREVRTTRARNRAWCATHRNTKSQNLWLRGAPTWSAKYLPGGACQIDIRPLRWPLEHRNLRLLHGALSVLADVPHDRACPAFALAPTSHGCGWYVHWWSEDVALRLAGRTHEVRIARQPVDLTFGPLVRVRAPAAPPRGRRRVRIDALTPVVISKTGKQEVYTAPTTERLMSALANASGQRFGLAARIGLTPQEIANVQLELVERSTEPATVPIGGHTGTIRGWVGSVVVDANASARWLLECAARGLGLGGRTAFGFGRVRVAPWD
jgi:hypothetical protein